MIRTDEPVYLPETFLEELGCEPEAAVLFDIETTGLSPDTSFVFLIGLIRRREDSWHLTQYLAESAQEESALLQHFLEDTALCSSLIHFNGLSFDLPYLEARLQKRAFTQDFEAALAPFRKRSLDLYRIFRPLKTVLGLKQMNQSTLEKQVGWKRDDAVSGRRMIALYHAFAQTGDPGISRLLLLHNHDDLLGMTHILRLAAFLPLFRGEYRSLSSCVLPDAPALALTVQLRHPLPAALECYDPFSLSLSGSSGQLLLPGLRGELKYFFTDYRNYCYLPLEDQAIHKSVAMLVDRRYRVPARPETCYTRRTGLFFRQPADILSPVFQTGLRDQAPYFEYRDDAPPDRNALCALFLGALRASFPSCKIV